ncbi:HPP family protein [Sphingomonas desiccabilis]|uniref:HPP family protein n=1 Tax=Sphingomonas desiccabilis TaxID=429134 RepID=A0A4Q2IUX2_9SPHN|nr:HPP family protein [Sphingomonas desiccabilis]MBB3910982.1 CBS domain-containing membrane protein [Sphingomonas desiccabilis]RXZ32198.1 HPP family protein [Sphingomonas desiccabilis]
MRRFFVPILAGGTLPDRLFACLGAVFGIALTGAISVWFLGDMGSLPLLVAPMGAAAVLVFVVPASPLAQPWSVVGGNIVSALVGVTAARFIPVPHLAAGVAVGGAILAMSLLRCLHPPGGAAALTAVVGGPVVVTAGYGFALVPVGLNAVLLMLAGVAFHRLSGHSYPHRPVPVAPAAADTVPHPEDLDRALEDLGETFDVTREDLDLLFRRMEHHAKERRTRGG